MEGETWIIKSAAGAEGSRHLAGRLTGIQVDPPGFALTRARRPQVTAAYTGAPLARRRRVSVAELPGGRGWEGGGVTGSEAHGGSLQRGRGGFFPTYRIVLSEMLFTCMEPSVFIQVGHNGYGDTNSGPSSDDLDSLITLQINAHNNFNTINGEAS